MEQKILWKEIVKTYPDEWVVLINYKLIDAEDIEGTVVTHHRNRKIFHEMVGKLLPKYGDMAVRFTGPLIKNPEIPILWQILDTD